MLTTGISPLPVKDISPLCFFILLLPFYYLLFSRRWFITVSCGIKWQFANCLMWRRVGLDNPVGLEIPSNPMIPWPPLYLYRSLHNCETIQLTWLFLLSFPIRSPICLTMKGQYSLQSLWLYGVSFCMGWSIVWFGFDETGLHFFWGSFSLLTLESFTPFAKSRESGSETWNLCLF